MTDHEALYRAVCENPAEETPRLAYVDALLEADTPETRARAEFVTAQREREAQGEPPPRLGGRAERLSPGRYRLRVWDGLRLAPGARVDLESGPDDERFGLTVERTEPDDPGLGTAWAYLARDAGSGPYPRARAAALDARLRALFAAHAGAWCAGPWCAPAGPSPLYSYPDWGVLDKAHSLCLRFEGGFPAACDAWWGTWGVFGDALCEKFPLRRVHVDGTVALRYAVDAREQYVHAAPFLGGRRPVRVPLAELRACRGRPVELFLKKRWPSVAVWAYPPAADRDLLSFLRGHGGTPQNSVPPPPLPW